MGVCSEVKQYNQMYDIAKKSIVAIENQVQKAQYLVPSYKVNQSQTF